MHKLLNLEIQDSKLSKKHSSQHEIHLALKYIRKRLKLTEIHNFSMEIKGAETRGTTKIPS